MNLEQIIDFIKTDRRISKNIAHWETIESRNAQYVDFPEDIPPEIKLALNKKGINKLYIHQAEAYKKVKEGKNIVVVTPTASGKSLCYNLPIFTSFLNKAGYKALYLFPTKALSYDQLRELYDLVNLIDYPIKTYTFDGDTPSDARKKIRMAGDIVISNPDMLHTGILPHHTIWTNFFESLKYVVIDELHIYRGIFGSHVANVIRRLKRIANFYGSRLQFICSSATIGNPAELASNLIGEDIELIDNNGAPSGEKHFILYNPPVVNIQLGIRRSVVSETIRLAKIFISNGISTIIFGRSRLKVEIILTQLKQSLKGIASRIRGYRGGYLPNQRRIIEKGLKEGEILGIVSTNALELGIDIGQLDVSIMAGFPGSIASLWQQAGRAGRKSSSSISIMVASSSPIDQYIIRHPEYIFKKSPENGVINPDNLLILTDHIKCAVFELPFSKSEVFGNKTITDILEYLRSKGILTFYDEKFFWSSDTYPAQNINLRSASNENFTICDLTKNNQVIGEVDFFSAPVLIHKDAIYIHESETYQVIELDWEKRRAFVKPVKSDYYTDAQEKTDIEILYTEMQNADSKIKISYGELNISKLAVMYKKIKFHTFENVGWGEINLPEIHFPTMGAWIEFNDIPEQLSSPGDLSNALGGLANLIREISPIYLFCDRNDINTSFVYKHEINGKPTIFLYDVYPGGIGLSLKFYNMVRDIIEYSLEYLRQCPCRIGCPSCVGPLEHMNVDNSLNLSHIDRKKATHYLLEHIISA